MRLQYSEANIKKRKEHTKTDKLVIYSPFIARSLLHEKIVLGFTERVLRLARRFPTFLERGMMSRPKRGTLYLLVMVRNTKTSPVRMIEEEQRNMNLSYNIYKN